MGKLGALQSCFRDIKQVKSKFFSRNHRHEAPETGDFPHLRLHWGAVAGPGQASPSAAQPTSEVGAIKGQLGLPLQRQHSEARLTHGKAWAPSASSHCVAQS